MPAIIKKNVVYGGCGGSNVLTSSDVVDNLTSTAIDLPLSANQGRLLAEQLGGLILYAMSESDFATIEEDTQNGLYILY
jgi:hypothetical protein